MPVGQGDSPTWAMDGAVTVRGVNPCRADNAPSAVLGKVIETGGDICRHRTLDGERPGSPFGRAPGRVWWCQRIRQLVGG